MRRPKFLIPLVVASVITAALGVALIALEADGSPEETDEIPVTEAPESTEPAPESTPTPKFSANLSAYEKYMNANDDKYLVLVNKEHTIDGSFQPEELVEVKDANKNIELSKTAEMALEAMFKEMRTEGITDVFVTSAYRSYSYQTSLFNTYIEQEMASGLSYDKARERVLTYSAYPGTSEHHTGLCVDLMTRSMSELDESFASYEVYPWLLENAWKFGFILRYPEEKTEITGYTFEPWHYRFVGRDHAYKMKQNNLCLEEYLAER